MVTLTMANEDMEQRLNEMDEIQKKYTVHLRVNMFAYAYRYKHRNAHTHVYS